MRVLKFGGSSVATPERVERVAALVAEAAAAGKVAVVVSAFGGVTDQLLGAATRASRRDGTWNEVWEALRVRHREAARALATAADRPELEREIDAQLDELGDLLNGVFLLVELSPRSRDAIASYGERLSAPIVAAALRKIGTVATALDARRFIVTDDRFGEAKVDFAATDPRVAAALGAVRGVPVITGFVASSPDGSTTTLGRGGSDYTASIVGAAVGARVIELWTDVSGVMSADPRLVPDATILPALSYAELMELSHFGAKVVHPPSVHPARTKGIPLLIKNTFEPSAPGTLVTADTPPEVPGEPPIRGISSIREVALARLEGEGMVGVPGIASRLFGALARERVNVILISQASSEQSICFAVAPADAARARAAVDGEFVLERQLGMVENLVVEPDHAIVAAVGDRMRQRSGLAARLFGVLGRHHVNVKAIAQGSSELNVSIVVEKADESRAVQAVHTSFFHPRRRRLAVAVLGRGRVGGELLDQLAALSPRLAARDLELVVVAAGGSRALAVDPKGLDLSRWRELVASAGAAGEQAIDQALVGALGATQVVVDATASDQVASRYTGWLERGFAVVAANKRLFAGPLAEWEVARQAALVAGVPLLHETTVGAGLPILTTLADLVATGDRVDAIDGVLSGTMNAVLASLAVGSPLSVAVRAAFEAGLTEPHPWEDLCGLDVARKLVILARLAGRQLELEDLEVEPLLPGEGWGTLSLEEFWARLPHADAELAARRDAATAAGKRLRYLARLNGHRATVGLVEVSEGHAAWDLAGPDNLVAFTTERYADRPLVVRGPGAGPRVTAAGLVADLLRVADLMRVVG